ncbi:transient receptor potential cation channel subfamily M member 7-like, partial [Saccoglossus kowalevskii]
EVQTQMLGNMLCKVFKKNVPPEYGETPCVVPCYLLKVDDDIVYYTLEEFIPGKFIKYLNNNGMINNLLPFDMVDKMAAFVHWAYAKYNGRLLLMDLQGVGYTLTDVAVATWDLVDSETHDLLFGMDNISRVAIVGFSKEHVYSDYFAYLNLPAMEELSESMIDDELPE